MLPTSSFAAANLDNNDFQNARPLTNEYDDQSPVQLASYASSEPEAEDEIDEINNNFNDLYQPEQFHPLLRHPLSTNFLVREEDDGGILIEPDQLSGELSL